MILISFFITKAWTNKKSCLNDNIVYTYWKSCINNIDNKLILLFNYIVETRFLIKSGQSVYKFHLMKQEGHDCPILLTWQSLITHLNFVLMYDLVFYPRSWPIYNWGRNSDKIWYRYNRNSDFWRTHKVFHKFAHVTLYLTETTHYQTWPTYYWNNHSDKVSWRSNQKSDL